MKKSWKTCSRNSLIEGSSIALNEIGGFYKKKGGLDPNIPTHWYLKFSDRFALDENYWIVFFTRALMLLGNAEDELDENLDDAIELIIEANKALDAGILASEKAHGKIMDTYAIHIHENYGGVIFGVEKKKRNDKERAELLDSLVAGVKQRCIEFEKAGVLDSTDMKFHCDHVCKEAGLKKVKRLQNRCAELGLGKRYFPNRSKPKD